MAGRRVTTTLGALAAGALVVAFAPGAHADPMMRYTYVANPIGLYTTLDEAQPSRVAIAGQLRFTPRRTVITIQIDDRTVFDGQTVAIWIRGLREGAYARCLRVRTVEVIRGVEPGTPMMVTILGDGARDLSWARGCTGHPSGGTAAVTL